MFSFNSPTQGLIALTYYALVIGLTFFAALSVYILIRYGKTLAISFGVSVVFILIFLSILSRSYILLQSLNF